MQSSNFPFIPVHPERVRRRVGARVCAECSGTQSKAWRAGQNGETLCNKCGLRNRRTRTKSQQASHFFNPELPYGSVSPTALPLAVPVAYAVDEPDLASHDYPSNDPTGSTYDLQVHETINHLGLDSGQSAVDELYRVYRSAELISIAEDAESSLGIIFPSPTQAFMSYNDPDHLEFMMFTTPMSPPQTELDGIGSSFDHGFQARDGHLSSALPQGSQARSLLNQLLGTSPHQQNLTTAEEVSSLNSVSMSTSIYNPRSNDASGAVMRKYVQCLGTLPNVSAIQSIAELLGSQISAYHPIGTGASAGISHPTGCKCLTCLRKLFSQHNITILDNPTHGPERWLNSFYNRAAAVHLAALRRGSSMYAATEMFLYEHAGDCLIFTVFAILREEYVNVSSPFSNSPSMTPHEAARSDLVFDFIATGMATRPILDDWLHGQLLIEHLDSERVKSAFWDLSRVPTGSHLPDSKTFRWLQRFLIPMNASSGAQNIANVQSGSPDHQLRVFHRMQAVFKYITTPERLEKFRSLGPVMLDTCIRACQEWLVAVLDEATKRPGVESQFEFLEANKEYTLENIVIHVRAFRKMNINRARHICSPICVSHIQPTFDTVMGDAEDALHRLFSPNDVLPCVQGIAYGYPTREQLFLARILGMAFFKIYYSHALFSNEQRVQHSILTRMPLVKARVKLIERSGSKLIWNYLPVEIAQAASARLDLTLQAFSSVPSTYDCQ